MTIEEAVEILNKNKHRHSAFYQGRIWQVDSSLSIPNTQKAVLNRFSDILELSEFECIAIAEKYERERKENDPDSSFNQRSAMFDLIVHGKEPR